jgi:urease accessory protein
MIATLHIETALRGNITFLKTSYCTTPFKVANITEDKKDNTLRLMLMSSSPGILDGDVYQQKIMLAPGCALELQTQSYQRLFNMKVGASQNLEVHQSEGSAFLFLPHPSVPHEAAIFSATNKIFLSDNCSLIFGEILTCGRKLSGEAFLFSKYHNLTQVYLNNKLIIKENLLMQPATININAIGQLEGFTHQASLIYLHETADCESLLQTITEQLTQQSDIIFGITAAPINGLIIRILGQKGEQLHNCLKNIAAILPQVSTHKTEAHAV